MYNNDPNELFMRVLHVILFFSVTYELLISCSFCHLQMMAGFHPQQREQRQHRLIHRR